MVRRRIALSSDQLPRNRKTTSAVITKKQVDSPSVIKPTAAATTNSNQSSHWSDYASFSYLSIINAMAMAEQFKSGGAMAPTMAWDAVEYMVDPDKPVDLDAPVWRPKSMAYRLLFDDLLKTQIVIPPAAFMISGVT